MLLSYFNSTRVRLERFKSAPLASNGYSFNPLESGPVDLTGRPNAHPRRKVTRRSDGSCLERHLATRLGRQCRRRPAHDDHPPRLVNGVVAGQCVIGRCTRVPGGFERVDTNELLAVLAIVLLAISDLVLWEVTEDDDIRRPDEQVARPPEVY